MKKDIFIDITPPYLAKFWVSSYGLKWCQPIKLQDSLRCNNLRKKWMMKFIFCMQTNIKVIYKIIVSLWVCVARHAQRTENNKFTRYSQYLKENVKDEVDFLSIDKCRRFLQSETIILHVCGQAWQNYQNNKFAISLRHVKKEMGDVVEFLQRDKHESLPQIDTKIFWWG